MRLLSFHQRYLNEQKAEQQEQLAVKPAEGFAQSRPLKCERLRGCGAELRLISLYEPQRGFKVRASSLLRRRRDSVFGKDDEPRVIAETRAIIERHYLEDWCGACRSFLL